MTNDPIRETPPTALGGHHEDMSGPSPLDESRLDPDIIGTKAKSARGSVSSGPKRRALHGKPRGPLKKGLFFLLLCLGLYSLAGFVLAPYLLTATLPAFLAKKLNRPVTIGSAQVNPYTLHVTLKNGIIGPDLAVADDKIDPALSFGRIEARINPAFFIKQGHLLKAIRANSVFAHLTKEKDGRLNFATMLSRLTNGEAHFNFRHLAGLVQAGDMHLTDSRLIFTNEATASHHVLEEIHFSFSREGRDSTAIAPRFSAIIDGSPLSVGGQSEGSAAGEHTRLTFNLEQINIADYAAYLPHPLSGLIAKGVADLELLVDYRLSAAETSALEIKGSGVARDIWLHAPENSENKIAAAHFSLRFAPLLSQLTIDKLILDQPELQLQRRKDGSYTFPGASLKDPAAATPPIMLENLVVQNGRLSFIDQKVKGGFGAIFNDINLSMERADIDDKAHTYALNCVTSRKTRIASQGTVSLNKGDVDGLLILHNLSMPALNTYLPPAQGITLSSGIVDKAEATLHLSLHGRHQNLFSLRDLQGSATDLDIYHQGKKWLHVDQGTFTDVHFASDSAQLSLGHLSMAGFLGHLSPTTSRFLAHLFSAENNQGAASLSGLEIKKGTLFVEDFSFQKKGAIPVALRAFNATGLDRKEKGSGTIDATFGLPGKGRGQLQGDLSLAPLAGELQLSMEHVALDLLAVKKMAWFQPEVQNGFLAFSGEFSLPDLSLRGQAALNDFQARSSTSQEELIILKKAASPQIHLELHPFTLTMDTLNLEGFELFVPLTAEQDSAFSLFFKKEKTGEMAQGNMEIKEINLQNGSLHFSDQSLNPPFGTTLTAIHGSVANVANRPENSLTMDITGRNEEQATLQATGSLHLFAESLGADLNLTLTEQPLEPFLPYLEPMIGHSLEGGIFDLSVSYKEAAGQMHADTVLTLRHLRLGAKELGNKQFPTTVALLTNNKESIRLEIPVVSDMADPSYAFHSAYGKKLRALISKASVSPFSMLTDFFDQNVPAPDHILFAAGGTEPTAASEPHLGTMKKILTARPYLTLTLKGYSAGSEDRDALLQKKRAEYEKKRIARQNSLGVDIVDSYGKEEIETPATRAPSDVSSGRITVAKEELLALAKERCLRLKEILTKEYGIDRNRIHISPDTTVVPESGAGLAGNRADFILGSALPAPQ
ncbi:MAG: DUF748 domain-containing protein [Desulfurivibrionaceae bacterium]|nr:DUF748 domain-containing protein [Desulfurivibrionaceae bacterium]